MDYLQPTIRIAKAAGDIILRERQDIKFTAKSAYDILADADLASEKFILQQLRVAFPGHSILSEEAGDDAVSSDFQWIVDPVDGTINFSQGLADFCVSMALVEKGQVILAVIYQPLTKDIYTAERGQGSFLNGQRIHISQKNQLRDTVGATESSSKPEPRKKNLQALIALHDKIKSFRIMGSAALNLSRVSAGKLDFYFNHRLNFWDVAAGILLIQEAGGKVTDLDGQSITKNSQHSLMANPVIHEQLAQILKTI